MQLITPILAAIAGNETVAVGNESGRLSAETIAPNRGGCVSAGRQHASAPAAGLRSVHGGHQQTWEPQQVFMTQRAQ